MACLLVKDVGERHQYSPERGLVAPPTPSDGALLH